MPRINQTKDSHTVRSPSVAFLVGIALLACLMYAGTLNNEFVFDDEVVIVRNESLRRLDSIPQLFAQGWWHGTEDQTGMLQAAGDPAERAAMRYRPLVAASYVLNFALGGPNPQSFHLVNVMLHVIVSGLLYAVALQLGLPVGAAAVAASLFAIHPLHTEAVAWVVGRSELLMSAWVLGGLWCVMRGYRRWALFAFVGGLLSKEQAVVFPGLVLLYDLLLGSSVGHGQTSRRWLLTAWQRYGWYLAILAGYLLVRLAIFGGGKEGLYPLLENPLDHVNGFAWIFSIVKMAGRYLWLILWPAALSVDYSYNAIPMAHSLLEIEVLWGLVAWGGLLWLARASFKRDPRVSFAIGMTILTFAPTSNVVASLGIPLAERVFYLPSAGLCLLGGLVWTWAWAWGRVKRGAGLRSSPAAAAMAGLMITACLGLAVRTILRVQDWATNETLFSSAVKVVPGNAKAHAMLADALRRHPRQDAMEHALAEYQTALAIYPDYLATSPHFATNFGHTLLDLGHSNEAVLAFQKAIAAHPQWGKMHYNLGVVFAKLGQYDKAEQEWKQALALNSNDPQIHSSLSRLAIERGQYEEALAAADKALASDPGFVMAAYNRGLALQGMGRQQEAARAYEQVLGSPSAPEEVKQDVIQKLRVLRGRSPVF